MSNGLHEYALAIDVGGTKAEAALIDRRGLMHEISRIRRTTGPEMTGDALKRRSSFRTIATHALEALPGHRSRSVAVDRAL